MIKRKKSSENSQFVSEMQAPSVSREEVGKLIIKYGERVKDIMEAEGIRNPAFAWSGGKDSQALYAVMAYVGITQSMMATCEAFEFRDFYQWALAHRPAGCVVMETGYGWDWLKRNEARIFPRNTKDISFYYQAIQNKLQRQFIRENMIDGMFYGRRNADGNFTGKNGVFVASNGVSTISPLYDMSHEEVIAITRYYTSGFAPIYKHPMGFIFGTGIWAGINPTKDDDEAWRYIAGVQPDIISDAAENGIDSAKKWLKNNG